jgi:choline monooxygenase
MSDLALSQRLLPTADQLPVKSYFDVAVYQLEQERLFSRAPLYYGHELMVPNEGDYHTIAWLEHGRMLKRAAGEVCLLSNVCRHRQSLIYQGRGTGSHVVCNLHGWTYDNRGHLLGAPLFPQTPCLNLEQTALHSWHGLLFDAKHDVSHDLAGLGVAQYLDFTDFAYHSTQVTEYGFNWKTFIEVYSEDYHVDPFHPGLGNFVDCGALEWEWGERYHVQSVGIKNQLKHAGSKVYAAWQQAVSQRYGNAAPEFGALWLVYYPNLMIEWYPHVLVVSVVIPRGVEQCTVVTEFYYPEEIMLFEPEFIAAEQAAYLETAHEDDEICERMHQGRRALWLRGDNEVGPYQLPTEAGMQHFHAFYRRMMGADGLAP